MEETVLSLGEVETLAREALQRAGAAPHQAGPVARSIRLAERDGIRSHGLMYLPIYVEHLRCGKVRGEAVPRPTRPRPATVAVDAGHGFAHPASEAGWPELEAAARALGIAAMTVRRSYNCGVLGHHVERGAAAGFLALGFTHAPASIAPPGGAVPVIGTNPFALAAPDGRGGTRILIDQSASVVAKSEIMRRAREGRPIEPGWAVDAEGRPTTDARAALAGSMLPAGGHKGFGVGLMVEIVASVLAGAVASREASPFSGPAGGPPGTGQSFVLIDPDAFDAPGFTERLEALARAVESQPGARLPGARRAAARARIETEGVRIDPPLRERLEALLRE